MIRRDSEVPLFDGQGTERTVTNGSQTVVGTLNLDGFGNQVGSTGSSSSPYMYAATSGYRNDNDAGLTHVGARYYDAQVGRFITRDTYLDENPFLYCEHDPVNGLDPSGHKWGEIGPAGHPWLDIGFNHNDWVIIGRNTDDLGNKEIIGGGGLWTGGSIFGPGMGSIPGMIGRKGGPWTGPVRAVGGTVFLGGWFTKFVGWLESGLH